MRRLFTRVARSLIRQVRAMIEHELADADALSRDLAELVAWAQIRSWCLDSVLRLLYSSAWYDDDAFNVALALRPPDSGKMFLARLATYPVRSMLRHVATGEPLDARIRLRDVAEAVVGVSREDLNYLVDAHIALTTLEASDAVGSVAKCFRHIVDHLIDIAKMFEENGYSNNNLDERILDAVIRGINEWLNSCRDLVE